MPGHSATGECVRRLLAALTDVTDLSATLATIAPIVCELAQAKGLAIELRAGHEIYSASCGLPQAAECPAAQPPGTLGFEFSAQAEVRQGDGWGGRVVAYLDSPPSAEDAHSLELSLRLAADQLGCALHYHCTYTQLAAAESRARASEGRMRNLFDTMGEALAVFEVVEDDEGRQSDFRLVDMNQAFLHMGLGHDGSQTVGGCVSALGGSSSDLLIARLREVASTGVPQKFTMGIGHEPNWYSVAAYRHQAGHVATLIADITERRKAEEAVLRLSMYDTLTGVYNRHFMEREMARLETSDVTPCGVILGDLNGLKLTNDALGHEAGDELLCLCAGTLAEAVDARGSVGRWGGDELIILVPLADEPTLQSMCDTIKASLEARSTQLIPLSMALGWACKTTSGVPLVPILREAENRMYHNKLMQGRGVRSAFISSLRRTLVEKAYETEAHSSRLAELGLAIGRELNMAQNMLDDLGLLCMLHDIGKIGIPDEVLRKPSRLNPEEWDTMRRHSEIGYRIANASQELSHIAYSVLCHHERWNGSGYPLGLEGSNIPLISRVVAIADAYDAMTAGRAYATRKTRAEAMEELRANAGTQFDPDLVAIALRLLAGKTREHRHHAVSVM